MVLRPRAPGIADSDLMTARPVLAVRGCGRSVGADEEAMMRSSPDAYVSERVLFEDEMPTDRDVLVSWDFSEYDSCLFEDEKPTNRLAPGNLDVRVLRDVHRRDPDIFEEDMPTGRLESVDLDELDTRILKRPARWSGAPHRQALRRVPRAAMEPPPLPASLGKRSAVLVLKEDALTGRPVRAGPARVSPDDAVRAARRAETVMVKRLPTERRSGGRHVVRLALLGLVLCWQPAWWNVGDVHGRHAGVGRVPPRALLRAGVVGRGITTVAPPPRSETPVVQATATAKPSTRNADEVDAAATMMRADPPPAAAPLPASHPLTPSAKHVEDAKRKRATPSASAF
jgi:hypothetical protein